MTPDQLDRQQALQESLFRELWDQGVSITEISKRFGRAKKTIAAWSVQMGLPMRQSVTPEICKTIFALKADGLTHAEVARRVGKGEKVVGRVLAFGTPDKVAINRKWSRPEVNTLIRLWDGSKPPYVNAKIVGAALDKHPENVLHRARSAGLIGTNVAEETLPTPAACQKHAKACLHEGGFPAVVMRDGSPVWVWPLTPDV